MLKVRVIPTLLWKGMGLVKGVGFDSWRRVGPVLPALKVYNARDVDELVLVDIVASQSGDAPDHDAVADLADECSVPLTVVLVAAVKNEICVTAFWDDDPPPK